MFYERLYEPFLWHRNQKRCLTTCPTAYLTLFVCMFVCMYLYALPRCLLLLLTCCLLFTLPWLLLSQLQATGHRSHSIYISCQHYKAFTKNESYAYEEKRFLNMHTNKSCLYKQQYSRKYYDVGMCIVLCKMHCMPNTIKHL